MITIWKFLLQDQTEIEVTEGYEILSIAEQGINLYVWIKLDTEAQSETLIISVFGTGWEIHYHPMDFIGTALMHNGLVFHAFKHLPKGQ